MGLRLVAALAVELTVRPGSLCRILAAPKSPRKQTCLLGMCWTCGWWGEAGAEAGASGPSRQSAREGSACLELSFKLTLRGAQDCLDVLVPFALGRLGVPDLDLV